MAHGVEADFKVVSDRNSLCPSTGRALVTQLLSASCVAGDANICIECVVETVVIGLPYGISDDDVPIPDIVHQQLSMFLKHKVF